ncbi:MAG: alanine--tRNA ligase [Rickettsiales bacterium]|jgi:alanyl-tRNA synthetase|nr:alanine--tRNA ligase [Rickettsiales bacterium]
MMTLSQIRERFLDFFVTKGCKIIESSSVVPNDPTLLFTNSGMAQFKNYFKNIEKPEFTRIVTAQKCIRAGGKHNDLDNVGYTARHHTFFEMLGNFSFGDYFKKEAILWAWEFLTEELKISAEKLLVTIYTEDDESYNIWKNDVGLSDDKIIRLKENFWEMGDTGPCGACSEIFYDHGEEIYGGRPGTANEDGDRYIEIWNLVFTQYNRDEKGELTKLPQKNIDTGMGLERVTAILQGVHNNYDIDVFKKLIDNSKNIIGDGDIFCHRIIADHLRSSSFLIADGVLPSNEGRGYVLRRILRRAMLQIHKLGCKKTSMYKLVPFFIDQMGDVYEELKNKESLIMETLEVEENRFRETLENGIKILESKLKNLQTGSVLTGIDAFEMYDTFGFPLDLTTMILKDKNITVDYDGFEREMKKQKERAKASWIGSGDVKGNELLLQIDNPTEFEGYENFTTYGAKILKIVKDDVFVDSIASGDRAEIILDKTCFYGESGGQVGDTGLVILLTDNCSIKLPFATFKVQNTLKTSNGIIVHCGVVEDGKFTVGSLVNLSINSERRKNITTNHSSAHLLHYALRKVMGDTVSQKGSYIDENHLRFDVVCNKKISEENLRNVELIVNELILQNNEVKVEVVPIEKAKKLGAMMLFAEKYSDCVRVVSMGREKKKNHYDKVEKKEKYEIQDVITSLTTKSAEDIYLSVELCGGCHVKRTGDIGFFKIIKEESVAFGVRRIEAITGLKALEYVNGRNDLIGSVVRTLKAEEEKIQEKIEELLKENKSLIKKNYDLEKNNMKNIALTENTVNGINLLTNELKGVDTSVYRDAVVDLLKNRYKKNTVIVSQCMNNNKIVVIIGVSDDLLDRCNASELLKNIGGIGGGRSNLAMGNITSMVGVDILKKAFDLCKKSE